jgi:serine/arginine repetitive matrix protein 2
MVEDDDNYWDNVIEFGDGRQYKVEVVEQTTRSREQSPSGSVKSLRLESTTEVLVTKEERFADDFDRSWPRYGLFLFVSQTVD